MLRLPECDECGSTRTIASKIPGVLRCLACGHYFEEEDEAGARAPHNTKIPKRRDDDEW